MTPALKTILSNTYTKSSLLSRISLLRNFLEFQYFLPHEKQNLFFLLNEYITDENISRDELNALTAWDYPFYDQFTPNNLYLTLKNLGTEALRLDLVTVFLPFYASIYEVPKLGTWFRKEINEEIILDIKVDVSLIGGCALSWKGVYHDFSLRYYLEKNKNKINSMLNDYFEVKTFV